MTTTADDALWVVGKSTRTAARPQGGRGPEAARQHRVSRIATQVADGRELAVLVDGPWRGRWYWADELTAMQTASARHPNSHPAAELRTYAPSGEFVPHPGEPDVTGRVWRHHPHPSTPASSTRRTT